VSYLANILINNPISGWVVIGLEPKVRKPPLILRYFYANHRKHIYPEKRQCYQAKWLSFAVARGYAANCFR